MRLSPSPRTRLHADDREPPDVGLRVLRREARMVLRGASYTHRLLRSRLAALLVSTLAVDAVATILMYAFEHNRPGSGFHDVGGALFWVSAQLTTVSSQMPNPVTTPGRIIDVVLELWAVSVVATMAASLASFFLTRHAERVGGEDGG